MRFCRDRDDVAEHCGAPGVCYQSAPLSGRAGRKLRDLRGSTVPPFDIDDLLWTAIDDEVMLNQPVRPIGNWALRLP